MKNLKFLKKLLALALILIASSPQMLAWNPVYFIGDPTGNWTSNKTNYVISNNADEGSAYFYFAKNNCFAVYITYYNEQAGPATDKSEMNVASSGAQKFYIWGDGENGHAAKYVGNNGIVEVHAKQKDNGDDQPWIWLTRPTVYIRHKWNDSSWSNQTMTDNNDGTYKYTGQYSGSNATNVGPCSSCTEGGATFKYFTAATLVGSPAKGNRCLFEYNSSGFKGFGSQSQNTGSLTITKLCSVTYDGNGKTSGSVPGTQSDKKYNVAFTLATNTGTLAKTGYTLTGWNTANDGSGTHYDLGASFTPSDYSTTLYAEWTQGTTVDKNGGSANTTYTATWNKTSIAIASAPTRTGYTLNGYYAESGCSNKIAAANGNLQTSVTVSETVWTDASNKWAHTGAAATIYAGWTAKTYSITLHDNNGGSHNGSVTATFDGGLSSLSAPTRDGYHVDGYYKEAGLTNRIANADGSLCATTDYTDGSSHWTNDGAVTLYAKWEEDASNYTLTYGVHESGHGSLAAKNTSTSDAISSGTEVAASTGITMTASPSSYYEVEGWYNSSACTSTIAGWGTTNPKSFTLDNNYTIYVKFQPITYTITYNLNSGTNPGGAPTSFTVESSDVTLPTPTRTGYTFAGWYANSDLSTGGVHTKIASGSNGNKEYWAKWTENMTTITLAASPSGAGTFTSGGGAVTSVSAGVTTKPAVTAVPAVGYRVNTGATVWSKSNSNITLSSTTANPTTVTGCGTSGTSSTLTGTFTRTYAFLEGRMTVTNAARNSATHIASSEGGWDVGSTRVPMDYDATNHRFYRHTYKTPAQLSATQNSESQWFSVTRSNASGSLTGTTTYHPSSNTDLTSTGSANKKAAQTSTTSYNYKFNSSTTDGYAIIYFDEAGVWYELEHTLKYSANSGSGSAPATETYYNHGASTTVKDNSYTKTGYSFTGWKTAPSSGTSYAAGASITMNSNTTLYAQWSENKSTITVNTGTNGTVTGTGEHSLGVTTKHAITATPAEGYYFDGWEVTGNAVVEDASATSTNAKTDGTSGGSGTVTAKFLPLDRVYFRNWNEDGKARLWTNVYVYFSITFEDNCAKSSTTASNIVAMTNILGTDIYWAYVPRGATDDIAFSNHNFGTNYKFLNYEGVKWGDYNSKLNMFVPKHSSTETRNGTTYYKGYWMNYGLSNDSEAGYYLKRWNGSTYVDANSDGMFKIADANIIEYKLRIDNLEDANNKYMVNSAGGIKYITAGGGSTGTTITSSACTNVNMTQYDDDNPTFVIRPVSEGIYTITIDQSSDVMKISVNYPVAIGDYILENAYDDGSAKKTHSDVIKYADAATKTRYSMFLSNAGTATLKLLKCTAISNKGVPTWSAGDATNLSGILSSGDFTPGVYQFDIVVDKTNNRVSEVDSVRLYTGNFYLKTDAAPGGWVTYKRNIMDKNTLNFDRTSATFDNYWCHHYDSKDVNIKCVIANDYCNQLSDTLKDDGISRMSGGEPYVPVDGTSIRFSYNSATNTISRAYLGASSADNFLNIEANATPANSVYKSDGTTNVYGATESQRKFDDLGNWVYEMDLKVKPGGCAGVKAVYTAHTQTLIPTTNVLLGGSGSTKYDIRVVYDFKTNYLMTAFDLPAGDITDALSNVDMLWVRHKDDSPNQLTFGSGGSLSNVSVIAAIELRYNEMYYGYAGSGHVDLSSWTETSRPYLKYFVSFPFDVPVNSVFGLNQAELGREYVIQKYNGALRAKEGLFMGDGDNYWENLTKDSIMHANEGYCVIFDNDYARGWSGNIWDNKSAGSSVFLYFPASEKIASITNDNCTTKVASHECKVDRSWTSSTTGKTKTHQNTDSHWNMIGSPLFHDSYIADTTANADYLLSSYYELNYARNKWEAKAMKDAKMFKAMSSRLVQWYGTITWSTDEAESKYAPRRTNKADNYFAKLEIAYNGQTSDWTYVDMKDDADDAFILREDMSKIYNNGIPQIYTFAGDYDVAYNAVPVKNQTIPVGLIIRKNGTYTFSMPTNFSGTVTLIDTFAQTRTNLAIEDYEVNLEKGTYNERFMLEFDINNAPTAIDGATNGEGTLKDGKAHKFIRNGMMYILHDGVVYDAQGRKAE